MGENICKQSSQQGINLKNIQTAWAALCHTHTHTHKHNQKMGGGPKQTFLQRRHTDGKKHMRKCSTSLTAAAAAAKSLQSCPINTREMQNKTTMKNHPHTSQNGHYQNIYK